MPTIDSNRHLFYKKHSEASLADAGKYRYNQVGGLGIFDKRYRIISEVRDILRVIQGESLTLATGHLSPLEIKELVDEAKKIGIKKILVNHPDLPIVGLTVEE